MAPSTSAPSDEPPPLTKAQKARIHGAPIHRRIRHFNYGALAVGTFGAVANVTFLVLGSVWARNIIDTERWFIVHYTVAAVLSTMWLGYSLVFEYHVAHLVYPAQLKIDLGWIGFAAIFAACWTFYIYRKMQEYAVQDLFVVACSSGCTWKFNFVRLSPLVLAITTIVLGASQILLGVILYRNPLINPPLDEHGMVIPQDPETGLPLPLGPDGTPIIPNWLLPRDPKTGKLLPLDTNGNGIPAPVAARGDQMGGPAGQGQAEPSRPSEKALPRKNQNAAAWLTDKEAGSSDEAEDNEDRSLLDSKREQELGRKQRRRARQR